MYIAVCDDQNMHAEYTARIIEGIPEYSDSEIFKFSNPTELIGAIEKGKICPDIAVLDIQMEEMDGIRLAQRINAVAPQCSIVFLTAYLDYAPKAYDAEHSYFVLKSQIKERLPLALAKAAKEKENREKTYLTMEAQVGGLRLSVSEILYFERVLRKTKAVADSGEYWVKSKPDELLKGMALSEFFHCHQSFWVNMNRVVSLNSEGFTLEGGGFVPVSRPYKSEAKERFFFREN